MKKPKIRLSRISGCFVCAGQRVTGSGWTMREAWECWKLEMIMAGNASRVIE